jgi:hypothetical protein
VPWFFWSGLAWTLALVSDWRTTGFNALDTQSTMRSVIPAATLMALGVQASASTLLAGALQLAWKSSREQMTSHVERRQTVRHLCGGSKGWNCLSC